MENISLDKLNQLAYGNLTQDKKEYLSVENTFTKLGKHFMNFPFPDVEETYLEVNKIIDLQKRAKESSSWQNYLKFMKVTDYDFNQYFVTELKKLGFEVNMVELEKVQQELGALTIQLKQHYQRPRPYQFALYTEQEMNPFDSYSANSPSYPSGHSVEAYFTAIYLTVRFPVAKDNLMKLAQRISAVRETMGVHYQSDLDFGKTIAFGLSKHPEIIKEYLTVNDTTSEVLSPQSILKP